VEQYRALLLTVAFVAGSRQDRGMTAELADLLAQVAAKDRAAFAALYRATSAKLYGVVSRILPSGEASEALQEAYVKIWERAADYDSSKGAAYGWMATIARNRALDIARRTRPVSLEDMPEGFEPAAESEDPLASRDRSEDYAALMRCLARLEGDKRDLVLLAYYRGASREALSARYKAPIGTVKTWLRRSLAELRECLSS
jgi:RNA polymerase sigma-70 factor (ECF subfamily)